MNRELYFPLFVNLSEKKIVVIGAGKIANRRIAALTDFTERITVIAPDICDGIQKLADNGRLKAVKKPFERADLLNADIVLAATNDEQLNREIAELCREKGICVNSCSDKSMCDFFFPGVIHTDDAVVGVTANGNDHSKAKEITEKIKRVLENE